MSSPVTEPVRAVAKFFFAGDEKFFVKGVTYGPFSPDAEGHFLGSPAKLTRDLTQMREIGINIVRIYHPPPRWFLDECGAAGVRVLITLPWAKHIEFLRASSSRNEIIASVRSAVARNAGHPAIFGYLVGNEIASTMVRWLGVQRVTDFLERLIRVAREADPGVLYSYASFPPTEFLLPQNVDFFCFNVYLHNQDEFERYLLRLQNLAEERPLILGEFGMDTLRHSEDEQADMLGWHVDSVVRCGLAGTVFFAW
ncbi:MAG: glycosyl transferase, partial [Chthoniobacterales bacterium]|nr:glycosyl transferase [Chthoniobacterales bacterium]